MPASSTFIADLSTTRGGGAVSFLDGRVKRRSDDEAAWKIPSGGGALLSSGGSYRRNRPLSTRSSELSARLRCRTVTAKLSRPRRGCGSNALAELVPEWVLIGRPRREGTVREPARQQPDQGIHHFGREFEVELGARDGITQCERLTGGLRIVRQRPRPGRECSAGLPVALLRRERVGDIREQGGYPPSSVRVTPTTALKRLLQHEGIHELLALARLHAAPRTGSPPRLVDGHDLLQLGFARGPRLAAILREVEDAQLAGRFEKRQDALAWITGRWRPADECRSRRSD